MNVSIQIPAHDGVNWDVWQKIAQKVESLGFFGLYRSDHFTVNPSPPDTDSLELIVSLTYLALRTQRLQFGPLVAPVSLRDPIMLARQALALDDLSNGRMILGVGAGWHEREHAMFGYQLGDVPSRMARLREALEVITLLIRKNTPVSFKGQYYSLSDAVLLPRPVRTEGPPIVIGGNGVTYTLPLAATFAQQWNGLYITAERYLELSRKLDQLLLDAGREPGAVSRTVMVVVFFGRNKAELSSQLAVARTWDKAYEALSDEELSTRLRKDWGALVGDTESVIEQVLQYQRNKVDELIFQWHEVADLAGIERLAKHVLKMVIEEKE